MEASDQDQAKRSVNRPSGNGSAGIRRGEIVHALIRDMIIAGELRAGERIDQEVLATTLDVSRTPIREALLRLEEEGFIENVPYRGALVRPISRELVEEIYVLRVHNEGLAARLGATQISDAGIASMRTIFEELAAVEEAHDLDRVIDLNRAFHYTLYEAAASRELLRLINSLFDQAERLRLFYRTDRSMEPVVDAQHRAVLQAVELRDAILVEEAIRAHLIGALGLMLHGHAHLDEFALVPAVLTPIEQTWLGELLEQGPAAAALPPTTRLR